MTIEAEPIEFRAGIGTDIHRLVEGRKLMLGGIQIPHPLGLLGHSDGDAVLHAVIDALLGAAGMGDIGTLFQDTDPRWKDADSKEMLFIVKDKIAEKKWDIINVDVTIHAEQPRLEPPPPAVRQRRDPQRADNQPLVEPERRRPGPRFLPLLPGARQLLRCRR